LWLKGKRWMLEGRMIEKRLVGISGLNIYSWLPGGKLLL
jgi:hypothetical protein